MPTVTFSSLTGALLDCCLRSLRGCLDVNFDAAFNQSLDQIDLINAGFQKEADGNACITATINALVAAQLLPPLTPAELFGMIRALTGLPNPELEQGKTALVLANGEVAYDPATDILVPEGMRPIMVPAGMTPVSIPAGSVVAVGGTTTTTATTQTSGNTVTGFTYT